MRTHQAFCLRYGRSGDAQQQAGYSALRQVGQGGGCIVLLARDNGEVIGLFHVQREFLSVCRDGILYALFAAEGKGEQGAGLRAAGGKEVLRLLG